MPVPKLVLGSPEATEPERVERTKIEPAPVYSGDVFGTDYYKVTTAARRAPRTTAGRAKKVRVRYTAAAALERRLAEIEAARLRSVTEHAAPGIPASRLVRVKPEPIPKLPREPRAPGDVGPSRWVDTVARLDDAPYAGRRLRPEQLPDMPDGFSGDRTTDADTAARRERFLARAAAMAADKETAGRWAEGVYLPDARYNIGGRHIVAHSYAVQHPRKGSRALCGFVADTRLREWDPADRAVIRCQACLNKRA